MDESPIPARREQEQRDPQGDKVPGPRARRASGYEGDNEAPSRRENEVFAALRALPAAIFRIERDPDGGFTCRYCAGQLAVELDLTTSEVKGKDAQFLSPTSDPDELNQRLERAMEGEPQDWLGEENGRYFKYHVQRAGDDEEQFLVGCAQEVTDQIEANRTQRALYNTLVDRTMRLARANKQTKRLNYTLSHDLRNPLTVVMSLCEVAQRELERGTGDPLARIRKIRQAARRMNEMLTDVLKLSRSERVGLDRREVDLSAIAHDVLRQLAESEPERKVDAQVEPGLRAYGDPNLLTDVMENLLSNAWKYTGRTDRPRIRVGKEEREGQTWIYVEDNGIGFTKKDKERIFVPFKRTKAAEGFHGTGVGLATVKRIVERHGGEVAAQGVPGEGAVFSFTLPPPAQAPASVDEEAIEVPPL